MIKRRIKNIICIQTHTSGELTIKEGTIGEIIDEEDLYFTIKIKKSLLYKFKKILINMTWKADARTHLKVHNNFSKEYLIKYDKLPLKYKLLVFYNSTTKDYLSDNDYIVKIKSIIDEGCMDDALC